MTPKFNLQPVLDFRHSRVERLEVELGRLCLEQQRCREFVAALSGMQTELYQTLGQCQQGELDLVKISQVRSNLMLVRQSLEQQEAVLLDLDRQVKEKKLAVVEAKQAEEMLVMLKNKAQEQYQAEQALLEGRLQDDIYIAQAYRRSTNQA
jgi:flagellar export protein FliJ